MTILTRAAYLLLVLAIPAALVLAPMYLFITPGFIRHEYGLPGFPGSVRFDAAERIEISDAILHYVRGRITREQLAAVETAEGEPALNAREVDHLADVRIVMDRLFLVQGVATLAALVAIAWLVLRRQVLDLAAGLRHGVILAAGLIVVVVGYSLLDFGAFFTAFHNLFFPPGTWTFEFTDTLIQLYPLPLWMDAVWKIGVVVAIELAAVYALGAYLRRSTPPEPDAER